MIDTRFFRFGLQMVCMSEEKRGEGEFPNGRIDMDTQKVLFFYTPYHLGK